MSDNFPQTPGTGRNIATDQVTYSSDTADVQLMRPVLVTGAEGAKTVVELTGDATNGLDVDVTRLPALPAGTNNIGDVDVLSLPALPAGTNAIGKLAANSGVDIGDVDVLSLPPLPAGSNDIGGINVLTSVLPSGAATAAKQPALGTAGTPSADVITVQGSASGTPQPVSGTVTANAGTGTFTVTGAGGSFPVTDSGGSLTVDAPVGTPVFVRLSDGTAAIATLPVSAASLPLPTGAATLAEQQTQTTALQLLDDAVGATGAAVPAKGMLATGTDGTNSRAISVDATGQIQIASGLDHDAVNTARTLQVGGHASGPDVPPTAVSTAGDRVRAWLDKSGAQVMRRRKLRESYTAICRLAETTARMDATFTHSANTNKQLVTFHHAASATKEIRIQKVVLYANLLGTAAGFWNVELRAITGTPATGNPAITPKAHRLDAAATEAVCLVLPTTGGTDATANSPYGSFIIDHGIEATTQPTAHPLPQGITSGYPFVLYDASQEDDEMLPLVLRAGTLEGVCINSRDTAAMVLRFWAVIKFTEELV